MQTMRGVTLVLAACTALFSGSCGNSGEAEGSSASPDSTSQDTTKEASNKKEPTERATSIDAAEAVRGPLVVPVIAEGSLRTRRETTIKADVGGLIHKVYIEEGQTVRKGALLIQIDDREYQVELEEAESRYLEALGKLAADDESLESKTATENLESQLENLERMYQEGAITAQEMENRTMTLEVEAVKQGAYRGELVKVRSGLAAARAAKRRADLNLEKTQIRAPFTGVVTQFDVTDRERVTAGQTLCRLVDNRHLEAEVAVLESDLKGLTTGRRTLIEVPAIGKTLEAAIDVMSPDIDPVSRTCRILMRIENTDGSLRPGMFVRTKIAGQTFEDRLQVPVEAIVTRDGRPVVFKIEGDRARWVYVELGVSNDTMVEIAKVLQGGPLESGDKVVVSDHLTLTHQAKVKIKKTIQPKQDWAARSNN